jgi:hypothetical protein
LIICNLSGGLGNQMFQHACARATSLRLNMPLKYCTDILMQQQSHNGLELEWVFGLKLEQASESELREMVGYVRRYPYVRRLLSKKAFSIFSGGRYLTDYYMKFQNDLVDSAKNGAYLHGYWQSEKYFADISEIIRSDFTFSSPLTGVNKDMADMISQDVSVSIHVRRGDYVSNPNAAKVLGACDLVYYKSALEYFLGKYPKGNVFAFSDDPDWVAKEIQPGFPSMVIVNSNQGESSYIDMELMSMCDHHIISNSSFSWWGAWLNASPSKKVVAPKNWFSNKRYDSRHITPLSWRQL